MVIKSFKESYKEGRSKPTNQFILLLLIVPLRALFLMLGLGVLHNDWTPEVPALGFWGSVLVSLMITGVLRR